MGSSSNGSGRPVPIEPSERPVESSGTVGEEEDSAVEPVCEVASGLDDAAALSPDWDPVLEEELPWAPSEGPEPPQPKSMISRVSPM